METFVEMKNLEAVATKIFKCLTVPKWFSFSRKTMKGFLAKKKKNEGVALMKKEILNRKHALDPQCFFIVKIAQIKTQKIPKNFHEASKNTRENVTFLSPYNMRHHNHKKILKHCGLNLKRGENNNRNEGRWSLYSLLALAEKSQSFACRRMHLGGPLVTGDNQTPGTDSYYRQFNWETPFNYSKELNHLKKFAK